MRSPMSEASLWMRWLSIARDFGLAPHLFWRLSLREWRALVARAAPSLLSRAEFDALTARFPDDFHE